MKNKKTKYIFKRVIACVLSVFLLICLPYFSLKTDNDMELFYNAFVGSKSKYQGILEIWNIDTFEAGNKSKTSLLTEIAQNFQKKNKGLYVLVRNVTENECMNLLKSGDCPDLFSCGSGVASELKEYISSIKVNSENVSENLLQSGKLDAQQYAMPWCFGSYYLISTKNNLKKAGIFDDEVNLVDIALKCGYETTGKKKKIIYSLGFGMGEYLLPQKSLLSYYNIEALENKNHSYSVDEASQSSYSAYCRFVAGETSILLGTQRDYLRMKNRESLGKISDAVYAPLTNYTDLVQFLLVAKSDNELKNEYKQKFVSFIVGDESQKIIANSGVFSVAKSGAMSNITPVKIEDYKVQSAFVNKSDIHKLQQETLRV